MKAAVTREAGVIKIEEVPEPKTAPDQVKVKIAYAGLCSTDPENLEQRFALMSPEAYKQPRILGHEASGTIAEIGKNIKKGKFRVGQRVAMNSYNSVASGCFTEYAVYPESAIYPLTDDIPFDIAALLEPVSLAVHIIDRAGVKTGSSVAICGGGPIGLLCLEMALRTGAAKTLLSEPVPEKRELAEKLGADVVVDPFNENLEAVGKKLTDGRGFNTVIDASGSVAAAKRCINLADHGGTILWADFYGKDVEIGVPPFLMYTRELTITSTFVSPYSFPRALAMLPKLEIKSLITDIVLLKNIQKAFELHKTGKSIKVLIQP